MERRKLLRLLGALGGFAGPLRLSTALLGHGESQASPDSILGMYVHEGWPYRHPYAARTWTLEDWRGYADGLKKLGYNLVVIWPALETMPAPLTVSDRAQLEKTAKVIDILHQDFDMRAFLTLCPNVTANDVVAARYAFEERPLFSSVKFVNPADRSALRQMYQWRQELLRPFAKMDGIAIIDSDPGGYPGSTNEQFADLLGEHRRILDRLRPGIELYYWMHVGWEAYCHYYETGNFRWGTPAEAEDILSRLKKVDPHPWGITIHTMDPPPNGTDITLAKKFKKDSSALAFNYGAIEGEPEFPLTNFGGDAAFKAGQSVAPRGVVGNAQTHCLQLPNTFAFARGKKGEAVARNDYVEFADSLIAGQGHLIVETWEALAGDDSKVMRASAERIAAHGQKVTPGPLKGLLFGNPQRFLSDLALQLRMKATYLDFVAASQDQVDTERFRAFLAATEKWHGEHGYQSAWISLWSAGHWAGLANTLKKLKSPAIDKLLAETDNFTITSQAEGSTPFERVQDLYHKWDTHTTQLIRAMQEAVKGLHV